jgi:hydroxymethylpyrimidine pyrophosphatase-like HAD family hydrolase
VSPRVRAAIAAARERGVRVALVTGRRPPAARRVTQELGGAFGLVLYNGALVMDAARVLACRPLPLAAARLAIAAGLAAGIDPVAHVGQTGEGRLWVEGWHASGTMRLYALEKAHPDVHVVESLARELSEEPLQVMFGDRYEPTLRFEAELLQRLPGRIAIARTAYASQDVAFLDVLHPEVSKAHGLQALCDAWGLAVSDVLAVGDNWNDREMLLGAGRGVVMGNADPGLQALGLPCAPTNDEDGAAWAIERFLLEPARAKK